MNFEEPVGQDPVHKDLAPWPDTSSSSGGDTDTESDTSEPSGFIVYRLPLKKRRYKVILDEEELLQ